LSYTQFEYSNLHFDRTSIKPTESLTAFVTIKNVGERDGEEVVQLYIQDLLASVARPVKELKGFQRIALKKGESKEVSFKITPDLLSMLDQYLKPVAEPGEFRIMIGASSADLKLKSNITVR